MINDKIPTPILSAWPALSTAYEGSNQGLQS